MVAMFLQSFLLLLYGWIRCTLYSTRILAAYDYFLQNPGNLTMRNLVLVAMVLLGATVAEGRPTSLHLHLPPPPPKVPTPLSSTLPLLLPALSLVPFLLGKAKLSRNWQQLHFLLCTGWKWDVSKCVSMSLFNHHHHHHHHHRCCCWLP